MKIEVVTEINWFALLDAIGKLWPRGKAEDFCRRDVHELRKAANGIEQMLNAKERKTAALKSAHQAHERMVDIGASLLAQRAPSHPAMYDAMHRKP